MPGPFSRWSCLVTKSKLTVTSPIPQEINAPAGSHVFVSREKEVTQFEFSDARPNLLGDGRLAWIFDADMAERLMNHHFIVGQRILYVGEA